MRGKEPNRYEGGQGSLIYLDGQKGVIFKVRRLHV